MSVEASFFSPIQTTNKTSCRSMEAYDKNSSNIYIWNGFSSREKRIYGEMKFLTAFVMFSKIAVCLQTSNLSGLL